MLIQSATPPTATLRGGRRPPHKGSKSSKHGFYFYRPKSPGDSSGQKPCLSELLPHRDATATPGRPQQPHTAHLLSLDFREILHNNPPTRPETMLRTFTAQPGKASATLLSHTTGAANLISMVFQIRHPKCEVSLVFWTGVFLSPGRRIRVIGKETGPGPGGYG